MIRANFDLKIRAKEIEDGVYFSDIGNMYLRINEFQYGYLNCMREENQCIGDALSELLQLLTNLDETFGVQKLR